MLASPAPFEWIAKAQPEISSEQIARWYEAHFQTALRDVQTGRVLVQDPSAISRAKQHLECMKHVLSPHVRQLASASGLAVG